MVELINQREHIYYPRIEIYIKEHLAHYKDFIVNETKSLHNQELIDSEENYSSGLYNCDEIYVRAIADALGFMWLVN